MLKFVLTAFFAAPVLLQSSAFANDTVCIDPDGDGWGWDGSASCLVTSPAAAGSNCIDDDGDGWGWDGTASCIVGDTPDQVAPTVTNTSCVDDDGDGWGWDGEMSCRPDSSTEQPGSGSGVCVDDDGDGWGWDGSTSCRIDSTADPAEPSSPSANTGSIGRLGTNDLVAAHFDHGPDPDDGHAAAAAYVIAQELNLNMLVAGGTTGEYSADRYLPESETLMQQIFGQEWLDAQNSRSASAEQAARAWVGAMTEGGDVWIAEGGPSDFTAAVVRIIQRDYPEYNTRERVHVIQHSQWNEDHALRGDLDFVRSETDYVRIDDGNDPNATADLRQDGGSDIALSFVDKAMASSYSKVWSFAFDYLDPTEKLDFSDTVEMLYILDIGLGEISDVTDFARYFLE